MKNVNVYLKIELKGNDLNKTKIEEFLKKVQIACLRDSSLDLDEYQALKNSIINFKLDN